MNENHLDHVGWLLELDGTVRPLTAVQRVLWPSLARVTYQDGTTEVVPKLNVLSRDDLGTRYDFNPITNKERMGL